MPNIFEFTMTNLDGKILTAVDLTVIKDIELRESIKSIYIRYKGETGDYLNITLDNNDEAKKLYDALLEAWRKI